MSIVTFLILWVRLITPWISLWTEPIIVVVPHIYLDFEVAVPQMSDHSFLQQIPPSLPFARPRAKAKTLVVDQELLQCRLHFKGARLITKFSSAI